jgi:bifunctional non-homologous end joining protein LigD
VPAGDGWIHELKHDGFRILAFKDGDTVRLWSRNGRDWSAEFVALRGFPFKRIMLDGEAVALERAGTRSPSLRRSCYVRRPVSLHGS